MDDFKIVDNVTEQSLGRILQSKIIKESTHNIQDIKDSIKDIITGPTAIDGEIYRSNYHVRNGVPKPLTNYNVIDLQSWGRKQDLKIKVTNYKDGYRVTITPKIKRKNIFNKLWR